MTRSEKLTDKYIWLMLTVYPLFLGFRGYARLTDSKFIFFAAATGLWLAALLLCVCACREGVKRRLCSAHWAMLAFLAVCVLSTLCSPHGTEALLGAGRYGGLVTLLLYGGIFFGVSLYARPRREYAWAIGLSCTVCCAVAVMQLCGSGIFYPGELTYFDGNIRYSGIFLGTIGNAGPLCAYLCLAVTVCLGVYVTGGQRGDVWLLIPAALGVFVVKCSGVAAGAVALGLCGLMLPVAVVNTMPRLLRLCRASGMLCAALGVSECIDFTPAGPELVAGGMAALLFIAAAFLLMLPRLLRRFAFGPKTLFRFFLGLDVLLVAAGLLALWFYPFTAGTLHELSQVLHGNISDDFGSSRVLIWRECMALFTERPWLGGGPDTLALRLDIHFSRLVQETGETISTYIDNAHNAYLGHLVNTGLLGLLSYLALMACTAVQLVKSRNRGRYAVLGCTLACAWLEAFFGLDLFITAPVLWIFWALALGEEKACPPDDGQAVLLRSKDL